MTLLQQTSHANHWFHQSDESFSFTWPGKQAAFRLAQTPTPSQLMPMAGESLHWHKSQNLFIEGDNLDVLKLLQEKYGGQVKMIYIDPPYNTGKEFVYRDRFRRDRDPDRRRRAISGSVESNSSTTHPLQIAGAQINQRTMQHALWLSMMTPRLVLARNLMCADGLIFISIDDNEVHHLKMLVNEIFGEENFVAQFVWHSSTAGGIRAKYVNRNHEYVLCYARDLEALPKLFAPLSQEAIKQYKRKDERGLYREKDFAWTTASANDKQRYLIECPDGSFVQPRPGYLFRYVQERFEEALQDGLVVFKATKTSPLIDQEGNQAGWNIYIKKHLGDAMGAPSSLLPKSLVGLYNNGTQEIKRLFGVSLFNNPKPTDLLRYLLAIGTEPDKDDLVLDFFAGSCSMAHAVLAQNQIDGGKRRFIMVQQAEPTPENSRARQAGFETIAEIGKERIRRVLEKEKDIGFRVYQILRGESAG